jgi:type I restriction enzyme R subunit
MPTSDTSEKGLEAIIEASLLAAGYVRGESADYNREFCLDRTQLFRFLRATQPDAVARLEQMYGASFEAKLFKRISDQVKSNGIVEVLRKGIKTNDERLALYYPRPASNKNPDATANYQANIFSVTRQLHYSRDQTRRSLDMVIFINGLPIITFELKNNLTGQSVQAAMRQYRQDRDPREPLFALARCLVHFAVDDQLVYMTTWLRGEDTTFLPFNQGNGQDGAGNPVNPHGLKTAYLWETILTRESLSNIVEKFAQFLEKKDDQGKKRRELIFPRYHQLDLVRQLLAHARVHGAGRRYLVQHSAGSGKSNSIAWLAYQLVELTTPDESSVVFDSVIVVTDRRNLDRQIRDTIRSFEHVRGVVEAITEGSQQLRKALEDGKKIIITTVQKFPFIVQEVRALAGQRFAIIIDEAHSSQSGQAAAKMNVAIGRDDDEGGETLEDMVNRLIDEQKVATNASYFAFTATPKNKTLETFGQKGPDTRFHPFHAYTMKQAIEEGFILDVLRNFTPYTSYYRLTKKIDDDPEFDTRRAHQKIRRYVEEHAATIEQKARIMIDHFMAEVIAQKKINGQAKAMVVTRSIRAAIRYKQAFDAYLGEIKSPYKAIVAFSIPTEIDGFTYDEAKMNHFPSADIPTEFKKPEYRFLIVAEKFQTGFDEPLLHTMYVDKPLDDVKAVQTLSRLNRAYHPWKQDTFVLDFVNSADAIRHAFEPFYTTTVLSEASDIDRLNDLQDDLDKAQVYTCAQVDEVMAHFLNAAPRETLDPILDACAEVYRDDLDDDQQIAFKTQAKSFVRSYQYLVMIKAFRNPYWESLKTFLKLLLPRLPSPDEEDLSQGVLSSIDLDSYRVEREATLAIKLEGGQELEPVPAEVGGSATEPETDILSQIVQEFNQRFVRDDWTDNDRVQRFLFQDLPDEVSQDQEYQNARQHSDRQNARITFEQKLVDTMQEYIFDHTEVYRKFTDDPEFRTWLIDRLFQQDYDRAA